MSEQSRRSVRRDESAQQQPVAATSDAASKQERDAEVDSLLDEIDNVLEVNAEEFVRSFVQKGGQ